MKDVLRTLLKDESGQAMAEYGIIIGLIAVVVIAVVALMGNQIAALFHKITDQLTGPAAP